MPDKRVSFATVFLFAVFANITFTQVRYTQVGGKMTLCGLSYSRIEGSDVGGIQIGFTNEGRIALGVLANVSSLPNPSKSIGLTGEIGILKRHDQSPGISLLLAGVQSWFTAKIPAVSYQSQTYQSRSAIVGLDFYFSPLGFPAFPFLQASYAFGSTNLGFGRIGSEVKSFALGIDFLIPTDDTPKLILTPAVSFSDGKSSLAIQLAFVLS
ncbi:MAG: hypothetical protein HYY49_02215 [Ignavibacteriales bacterium]|nr:hypothetical protein [Ignavibacteriales bacterium]